MRRFDLLSKAPVMIGLLVMLPSAAAQVVYVDNSDPGFTVLSEVWSTTSLSGQYGPDYRYRSTSQAPGEVEWRPNLPAGGEYEVAVWYRSTGSGRPRDARYTVEHVDGPTDVIVDQRINGSTWVVLGSWMFDAGSTSRVTLTSAAEPGRTIVADAVRFRPLFAMSEVNELRACWLTQYQYLGKTEAQLRAIAGNIRAGNMNTVYIAAYSGATVYWPSKVYAAAGGDHGVPGFDMMKYLLGIFHDEGLKVGAWFEYGMAVGFASHPIATAHPEWLARDSSGDPVTGENGGFVFLSPGNNDAMAMLEGMVRELAENYDFDDIQIDRFRWGRKSSGREYGYESATADRYEQTYGASPPGNVNNGQWVAFREDLVNQAVERCYNAVQNANPEIVVSSAPTGSYGITQHMQRWSDWVEGDYMDLVMPQMYNTTYSAFVTEFNTQRDQAPAHLDRLGVGYRANDDNGWTLVDSQMDYARSQNVPHGCLWVYHQYSSQIAIQDEIDNLPQAGNAWETAAINPFASPRMVQLVMDDDDGAPTYTESGAWIDSAQGDYFQFGSRVSDGLVPSTAVFSAAIPKAGRYTVFAWYTASGNRNPQARYTVHHYNGDTDVFVDQRTGGGAWVELGEYIFDAGSVAPRLTISNADSAGIYTSADGAKLVLTDFALGDADDNGVVDLADYAGMPDCLAVPGMGPLPAHCRVYDFNDDDAVDLVDFAAMQRHFAGS